MQEKSLYRVAHLITKGSPFGGAQNYVYTLASHLPKTHYESVVLSGDGDELSKRLEAKSIEVICLPDLKRDINPFAEIRAFITLIKKLKELKPDVLHTNSSKAGLLGALAGRLVRVPRIVFTGHAWASNEDRLWIIRKFFLFLHWTTILLSDRTICVSKKTKNDVAGLRSVRNKTCVVYNGISAFEMEEKYTARISLQTMFNKGDADLLWLGTIAELHRNKGLDLLIEALVRITAPFQFFIIGEGEEREKLEELIRRHELEEKVFLVGKIPNAKKYLKAFDIFTLTSRTEALPYTVLEAGLAGLPVLASRVGGIPEIITNGGEGVLVRPNSEDIYQALGHLFSQANKRVEYGAKLKAKVEKEFSLEQQIAQTMKVYTGNF
jgi:glycosyltransferase involved in cell wall biosynthesis